MLRQELQSYLDKVYPGSKIEAKDSLCGPVHIRFELGGNNENGTIRRVQQATSRALTIFSETFDKIDDYIFVLIYEYQEQNPFNASNDYLHSQFPATEFMNFYNQLEIGISEETPFSILIGKVPVKSIAIENILNAIANTEMGFEPSIDQSIYFFDPLTDKAFHMYDDRGCYIWSDKADKIKDIYIKRNSWIVNYHRGEIDKYFS
jgi:hypothetical protein